MEAVPPKSSPPLLDPPAADAVSDVEPRRTSVVVVEDDEGSLIRPPFVFGCRVD